MRNRPRSWCCTMTKSAWKPTRLLEEEHWAAAALLNHKINAAKNILNQTRAPEILMLADLLFQLSIYHPKFQPAALTPNFFENCLQPASKQRRRSSDRLSGHIFDHAYHITITAYKILYFKKIITSYSTIQTLILTNSPRTPYYHHRLQENSSMFVK